MRVVEVSSGCLQPVAPEFAFGHSIISSVRMSLDTGCNALRSMAESTAAIASTPAELDGPEVNRRLQAQYAEIAQLAGCMAHEIRNPLSTMRLNLDLLAEDFREPQSP